MNKNRETLMKFISAQNQKVQDDISKQGYKDNSPYRNNPFNLIQGQPGQPTSITMQGVSTPLIGVDEYGNKQYMQPGQEYQFPGSQVTETPVAKYGGLLNKTIKCGNCSWEWKTADGGSDLYNCHKCGGKGLIKAQRGLSKNLTSKDSVNVMGQKHIDLEHLIGYPGGTPNTSASMTGPEGLNVVSNYVKNKGYGSAMNQAQINSWLYNAGFNFDKKEQTINPKKFILGEYYRKNTPYKKEDWDVNWGWTKRKTISDSEADKLYNETVLKLPEQEQLILTNLAKDWFYKNRAGATPNYGINPDGSLKRDKYGAWSPDYKDVWAPFIINQYEFGNYNGAPKLNSKNEIDYNEYYRNQTLPKSQRKEGGELPIAQEGIEYFNQVKDWYNKYTTSPRYKENLSKSGYEDPQAIIDERLGLINNTKFVHDENRLGSNFNNRSNTIHYSPIKDQINFPGDGPDAVLAHEFGHSSVDKSKGFLSTFKPNYNRYDFDQLIKRKKENIKNAATAHENYADQKAIQYEAEKQGLYKAGFGEFTEDMLDKLEESGYKKRALKHYSKKDLIWLLNNIAQTDGDANDMLAIAQEGGEQEITDEELQKKIKEQHAQQIEYMNKLREEEKINDELKKKKQQEEYDLYRKENFNEKAIGERKKLFNQVINENENVSNLFHEEWMASPQYQKLLAESTKENSSFDLFNNIRNNNLQELKGKKINTSEDSFRSGALAYFDPKTRSINYPFDSNELNLSKTFFNDEVRSNLAHEKSHFIDNLFADGQKRIRLNSQALRKEFKNREDDEVSAIPQKDVDLINQLKKSKTDDNKYNYDHYTEPTEVRARLNQIRENLHNRGNKEFLNRELNEEDLKALYDNIDISDHQYLKELDDYFGKENTIQLLNSVSQNNRVNNELPIAQVGTETTYPWSPGNKNKGTGNFLANFKNQPKGVDPKLQVILDKVKAKFPSTQPQPNSNKIETREVFTTTNDNILNASNEAAKVDQKFAKQQKYEANVEAKKAQEQRTAQRQFNALSKEEQERVLYEQYAQQHGNITQGDEPDSKLSKFAQSLVLPMTALKDLYHDGRVRDDLLSSVWNNPKSANALDAAYLGTLGYLAAPFVGSAANAVGSTVGPYMAANAINPITGATLAGVNLNSILTAGFAAHGAVNIGPDAKAWYNNPTPEGFDKIAWDTLEMLPIAGGVAQTMAEGYNFTKQGINKGFNLLRNIKPNIAPELRQGVQTAGSSLGSSVDNVNFNIAESAKKWTPEIQNITEKEISYITSPEYLQTRMANTGETKEQVLKNVNKILENINKTSVNSVQRLPSNEGDYMRAFSTGMTPKKGTFFPSLDFNPSVNFSNKGDFYDTTLGIVDHEIKHAFSPISTGSYSKYKNYPTIDIKIPTDKVYENYLNLPHEQQVRFNKIKDYMEEAHGIKKGTKFTDDNITKLIDDIDQGKFNSRKYSDVLELLNNANLEKASKSYLKEVLNKAWGIFPAALTYKALQEQEETPENKEGGLIEYQNAGEVKEETYVIPESELQEVVVEPSEFSKYKIAQKKAKSWEEFANEKYLGNFEKNMGQTINNLPAYRKQEYEDYIDKLAFDEYVKTHPAFKGENRGAYINRLESENANTPSFQRAYESNAPYNDATDINKWRKFLVGLGSIVVPKPAMDYMKQQSDYYSTKEKQAMSDNPISTRVSDVLGTIDPLTIPVETLYGNKSFGDIASGESADIPMSARILGDPLMLAFEAAPLLMQGVKGLRGAFAATRGLSEESALTKLGALRETSAPVQNVVQEAAVVKPWQIEGLPGLHMKSTMVNNPKGLHTQLAKDGTINTENALKFIKNNEGEDKYNLALEALGENIPKKMDYNEFRKAIQDHLIPLEQQFSINRSDYGIESIGYTPKVQGTAFERFSAFMNTPINELFGKPKLLENKTIIFSNADKFGKGSSVHGNPAETLGHIHYIIDAKTPNTITATQIQSDALQGTHSIMPKNIEDAMIKLDDAKGFKKDAYETFGDEAEKFKDVLDKADETLNLEENHIKNLMQKFLLEKDHQERFLQEFVDYAGKRGDVNKIRLPTSETAAKIQNYTKDSKYELESKLANFEYRFSNSRDNIIIYDDNNGGRYIKDADGNYTYKRIFGSSNSRTIPEDEFNNVVKGANDEIGRLKESLKNHTPDYTEKQKTILKKYSEQPKTIKKLFGVVPELVKDAKGNTWYEFDIPEAFKQGKGEIRAFKEGGTTSVKQKKALSWINS